MKTSNGTQRAFEGILDEYFEGVLEDYPMIANELGTLFSTSKSVYELDLGGHLFFSLFFTID